MPDEHFHECARCGQTVITRADPPICQTCKRLEARPQGEAVRLFEPAPAQLGGRAAYGESSLTTAYTIKGRTRALT